jgi:hypothetical protein
VVLLLPLEDVSAAKAEDAADITSLPSLNEPMGVSELLMWLLVWLFALLLVSLVPDPESAEPTPIDAVAALSSAR